MADLPEKIVRTCIGTDRLHYWMIEILEARAVRLELDILALRDDGVPLDDIEIVRPGYPDRPYVRRVTL